MSHLLSELNHNHHQGMHQGIVDAGAFILFLSPGVLLRPFCQVSDAALPSLDADLFLPV